MPNPWATSNSSKVRTLLRSGRGIAAEASGSAAPLVEALKEALVAAPLVEALKEALVVVPLVEALLEAPWRGMALLSVAALHCSNPTSFSNSSD